ncbi:MAG: tRNA (adenosine(37)-N6)-threonylcarbamoyltransferase complex ATPase subunit type 1 TsaE [Bacilli bacterium]|nr:tRNA (adenosine(37)-N6)-threonylcarbamoyltransferase complex ATPase subunit type 1 TsaE [Bacilli bacterium]
MRQKEVITKSALETKSLAQKIIKYLRPGDVVLLSGDLGAGKTTFVGGALEALGYKDHVVSPTFNILKCYFEVNPPVFHIDAYRLEDQNHDIGLEEFIEGNGITFIEWPVYIPELIPVNHIEIEIYRIDDNQRRIIIKDEKELHKEIFEEE